MTVFGMPSGPDDFLLFSVFIILLISSGEVKNSSLEGFDALLLLENVVIKYFTTFLTLFTLPRGVENRV